MKIKMLKQIALKGGYCLGKNHIYQAQPENNKIRVQILDGSLLGLLFVTINKEDCEIIP